MAVNKVIYEDKILIDLSQDTVTAETLAKGITAHDANGELVVGVGKPMAYTVSSVDELPSDVLDGSIAIVNTYSDFLGTWVLNNELPIYEQTIRESCNFTAGEIQYVEFIFGTTGPSVAAFMALRAENGVTDPLYIFEEKYGFTPGWMSEEARTFNFTTYPDSEIIKSYVMANGIHTNPTKIQKFYVYENGEWVYKSEAV